MSFLLTSFIINERMNPRDMVLNAFECYETTVIDSLLKLTYQNLPECGRLLRNENDAFLTIVLVGEVLKSKSDITRMKRFTTPQCCIF